MKNNFLKIIGISFITLSLISGGISFVKYAVNHDYHIFTEFTDPADIHASRDAIANDALACEWDDAPLLFFSENVFSQLIYYSHLFPAIGVLILAGLVFLSPKKNNLTNIFLILSFSYIAWCLLDLITWAHNSPDLIMFSWSLMIFFELPIYIAGIYLLYNFIHEKNPPRYFAALVGLSVLPAIFLAPTQLSLLGFDYTNCDREALEGPLWQYVFLLEMVTTFGLLIYGVIAALKKSFNTKRKQILLLTSGICLFFLAFSLGNIIGSFSEDWSIAQYGLLGMPVFLGFITYLIVQFRLYNLNIIAAQALVISLWVMIGSLLLVAQTATTRVVAGFTLSGTMILGVMLIRSIKRTVAQKEEITVLAEELQQANNRLKELDKMKSEFVSIASHQLRSPLTAIRGYASMLLEGSFGKLTKKSKEAVERIQESSRYMALSVEDYLNVSRIEAGNMKYELSDFNFKSEIEKVAEEIRPTVEHKGLALEYKTDCKGSCIVHADIGKMRQVLQNLIDNAMKYTPGGKITVITHDDPKEKKIFVTIKDTGVGMSKETIESLFDKFVRAQNANKVNVTGTGLGLFVAKKMVEDMGGRIWAESDGEEKGSSFHIEFPENS